MQKGRKQEMSRRIVLCLLAVVLLATPVVINAQGNNALPILVVSSKDSAHPVLLQALAEGQLADSMSLSNRASVDAEATDTTVYAAFQSTGWWTQAVIGLVSAELVRDNQYVALELDQDGVPVENGQAFALTYRAGYFLLPAIIEKPVTFGIFQITTDGGVTVTGQTPVINGMTVTQSSTEYQINPESPLGNIVVECHITGISPE
jgi:hypothetical protein